MVLFSQKLPELKKNFTNEQIYKLFFFGDPNYELNEDEGEILPKQDVDSYFKNMESSFKAEEDRIGKLLIFERRKKFVNRVLKLIESREE